MRRIEDNCCDCGLYCLGANCPNREVEVIYCDECGDEIAEESVYKYEGKDLCLYCYEELLEKDEE